MIDGNVNTPWTSSLIPVSGNGPWITFSFPSAEYVTAVQLVTTAPIIGAHLYRIYETTCCDHNLIGSTSISVTTGEHSTIIPVTPGNYGALTLMVQGSAGLLIREVRLLPIQAPAVLSATPADGSVSLAWSPVSANALAGYRIYANGVLLDTTSDTSYTATGLTNGQSYTFSVKAYDTSLRESQSSAWPAVVPRDSVAPATPTGLNATPGDKQVALAWNAITDSDFAFYRIYANQALVADNVTATSYTVGSLANGTAYQFEIAAVDTSGNESAPSPAADATPFDTTPPAVPTGLSATAGDGAVSLTWSANSESDFAKYKLYMDGELLDGNIATNGYTAVGLAKGTSYAFTVTAVDTSGNESAHSASVSAVPVDAVAPSAPSGLTATPGDGTVLLEWTANLEDDIAKYKLYKDGTYLEDIPEIGRAHV